MCRGANNKQLAALLSFSALSSCSSRYYSSLFFLFPFLFGWASSRSVLLCFRLRTFFFFSFSSFLPSFLPLFLSFFLSFFLSPSPPSFHFPFFFFFFFFFSLFLSFLFSFILLFFLSGFPLPAPFCRVLPRRLWDALGCSGMLWDALPLDSVSVTPRQAVTEEAMIPSLPDCGINRRWPAALTDQVCRYRRLFPNHVDDCATRFNESVT